MLRSNQMLDLKQKIARGIAVRGKRPENLHMDVAAISVGRLGLPRDNEAAARQRGHGSA